MPKDYVAAGTYDVRPGLDATVPEVIDAHALFWSARGEVACAIHVPRQGHQRWTDERWAEIPPDVGSRYGSRYQCQHCAESKTPIVHRRLNTYIHL